MDGRQLDVYDRFGAVCGQLLVVVQVFLALFGIGTVVHLDQTTQVGENLVDFDRSELLDERLFEL